MKLRELIASKTAERDQVLASRNQNAKDLEPFYGREDLTEDEVARVTGLRTEIRAQDEDLDKRATELRELNEQADRDDALVKEQAERKPAAQLPSYDRVARVGAEERTYRQDQDKRGKGTAFLTDVASAFRGTPRRVSVWSGTWTRSASSVACRSSARPRPPRTPAGYSRSTWST